MDVQMPIMDGYEATRQIRNPQSTIRKHNVPIIALTSSILRDELDKCALAGMDDYIPTPFKAQQLIVAIVKATGRQLRFMEVKTKEVENEVSGNKSVTDLTYLEEFCDGNKQRIKKYIDIFLASVPGQIEKISNALETNNWPEIGRQMHDFKTKLFMMGMHEAKDLATEIEEESMREHVADNLKFKVSLVLEQVKTATIELKTE
jgi:CheY-like chemotaxis protein